MIKDVNHTTLLIKRQTSSPPRWKNSSGKTAAASPYTAARIGRVRLDAGDSGMLLRLAFSSGRGVARRTEGGVCVRVCV